MHTQERQLTRFL